MDNIFDTSPFVPFGTCGQFPDWLLTIMLVTDISIALAYLGIPIMLLLGLYKSKKRHPALLSKTSRAITALFIAFILGCGGTHAVRALMIYIPMYYTLGLVQIFTAIVSTLTLGALIFLGPKLTFFQLSVVSDIEKFLKANLDKLKNINDTIGSGDKK